MTVFTPGPFLFCDGASRMEVAKEFLGNLHPARTVAEQERALGVRLKVLSKQSTAARLSIAIGEDVPQAVLAVMAMLNFQTFSGRLLLNQVFCCVKIAGILAIRGTS